MDYPDGRSLENGNLAPRSAEPEPLVASLETPSSVAASPRRVVAPALDEGRRLSRLLWIFGFLLIAFLAPSIIGRIQYAYRYNGERAEADAALETLQKIDMSDLSLAFRTVAKGVGPSVVHIRTTRRVRRSGINDEGQHLFGHPRGFEMEGQGSGVIVDTEGYIVTNNHVVADADSITVQLKDGRAADAVVIGADPPTDIAVLKINLSDLIAREWGNSDDLDVGSMVWAVGSPFGLQRSITFGIISAKNRRGVTQKLIQDFLQTDAAVNPGNSGGPLVTIDGRIVGINTAIVGQSYQGISFAIPSNTAQDIYDRIRRDGKISRGLLGVGLAEVTPEIARQLGLEATAGVLILRVFPGTPADMAGLQRNDIVLTWNDRDAEDPITLSWLIAGTEIGSRATIEIWRNGVRKKLRVTVGDRSGSV